MAHSISDKNMQFTYLDMEILICCLWIRQCVVLQYWRKQKEKAMGAIGEQFGEKAEKKVGEEVVELLNDIADAVIEGKIN